MKLWYNIGMSEAQDNNWDIRLNSFISVVGSNPEYADFANPRGEIFATCYYVDVTNSTGERFVELLGAISESEAEHRLEIAKDSILRCGLDPRTHESFRPGSDVYGSRQYMENWHQNEYDAMDEDERKHYGGV